MALDLVKFDPEGDVRLRLSCPPLETETDGESTESTKSSHLESSCTPHSKQDTEWKEIHMLVSSRHMMLASPVFKAMLQHSNFKEGEVLKSAGSVEISLPDDNPDAFRIILNIIHGHTRSVPRRVSLATMSKLSIVVDKYQLLDSFGLILEIWLPGLHGTLPKDESLGLTPDLTAYQWLSVAWVFKLPEEFLSVTRSLVRNSCGPIESSDPDLPIPDVVLADHLIANMEKQRQKAIKGSLDILQELIGKLISTRGAVNMSPGVCASSFNLSIGEELNKKRNCCDGMMLGTLLKSASSMGLYPTPPAHYPDRSAAMVMNQVRSLQIFSTCDSAVRASYAAPLPKAHGLQSWIHSKVDAYEAQLLGLDLASFA